MLEYGLSVCMKTSGNEITKKCTPKDALFEKWV